MGLIDRIARLLDSRIRDGEQAGKDTGTADPARRVHELIMEMRKHLSEAKATLALAVRDERRMERQVRQLRLEVERWQGNARQALEAGRDGLAREALKRKLGAARFLDELADEHRKLEENVVTIKRYVVELERKLKEAVTRERLLLQKQRRIRQAEYLKERFPEHRQQLLRAALEDLDDDTERLAAGSLLLEEDSLERRFRELENREELVDDELSELRKSLDGGDIEPSDPAPDGSAIDEQAADDGKTAGERDADGPGGTGASASASRHRPGSGVPGKTRR